MAARALLLASFMFLIGWATSGSADDKPILSPSETTTAGPVGRFKFHIDQSPDRYILFDTSTANCWALVSGKWHSIARPPQSGGQVGRYELRFDGPRNPHMLFDTATGGCWSLVNGKWETLAALPIAAE